MAMWKNLSYAVRRLRKSPGLVVAVVVSIGLGIGANATIFSMVSRFVMRPAPVGDPASLLALHTVFHGECCSNFPYPQFRDVERQAQSFSGVAAYYELLPASIGGSGEPERAWGQAATANFFDVTRMPMTLGRGFAADEERAQVIVLGYGLWKHRFHGDPGIVGKTMLLSGHPYTVIGVAPAAFHGVDQILNTTFWVPLGNLAQLGVQLPDYDSRNAHWLAVVARLKPGVTGTAVATELDGIAARLAKAYPGTDKDQAFRFEQAGSLPPRDRNTVLMFLAALTTVVLLVLCIAAANVANLLLAQASARQKEMAVRLALGATRSQLLQQLFTESVLLALLGGIFGAVLSLWSTSALSSFRLPAPVPIDLTVAVDWRVVLYTIALSIVTGLLFGAVPAWVASRPALTRALKGEDALARPGRRWNLRSLLIVVQMSMCIVLLCATGLFLRSLERATSIDVGFRDRGLLMMSVDPRVHGYSPERTAAFLDQLTERVRALPGVTAAVATDIVPLSGGGRTDGFEVVGQTGSKFTGEKLADLFMVMPGYFSTMGIGWVEGHDFAHEKADGPKVAVVNQEFVRRGFGSLDPLGREVNVSGVHYQIIGVVRDVKSRTLGESARPVLYRSLVQSVAADPSFLGYAIMVRGEGDTSALATAVRHQIAVLDPAMAVYNAETMHEHLREALFLPRLAATLFGIFGVIGLVLASVGMYGVMSYAVNRRTREIGIRIALGAQLGTVERLILRQGLLLTAIALVLGLPAAFVAARVATSFLYGVHPHDLATFTFVPIFLVGVALVACWIPARRAARIDPQQALRYE
jgi:predicted permease